MSAIIYAKKNADGRIVALSRDPDTDPCWSALPEDAPEVLDFIGELASPQPNSALRDSDLSFVRVLEDVIDLLIERGVIRFTDLPLPAQTKLLHRRDHRRQRQGLQLLDDEGLI